MKSEKIASIELKKLKLLRIKRPRIVPLKSDTRIFLVYSAKAMARSEGSKERAESSIVRTQ